MGYVNKGSYGTGIINPVVKVEITSDICPGCKAEARQITKSGNIRPYCKKCYAIKRKGWVSG